MEKSKAPRLTALGLFALGVVAMLVFFPVKEELTRFLDWVRELGDWGLVVLAAAYIPATVLFVPGTILTLGAGFVFGVVKGTIAISIGSTLGASAAFLVGRFLARGLIEDKIAHYPRFKAIDQAVAQQGFKIVLLTRLSPVFPFNFLNYAFGLTRVSFRDYFFASWIGMFPATVMYVYLGSLAGEVTDLLVTGKAKGGIERHILFVVGLIATVVVTVYVTRVARRALDQAIPSEAVQEPTPAEPGHE